MAGVLPRFFAGVSHLFCTCVSRFFAWQVCCLWFFVRKCVAFLACDLHVSFQVFAVEVSLRGLEGSLRDLVICVG